MTKSQFTEEQIAYVLQEVELGMAVAEICRKLGVSEQTTAGKGSLRVWASLSYDASSILRKRTAS